MPRFRFSLLTLLLLNFCAASCFWVYARMKQEPWKIECTLSDDRDDLAELIGEARIKSLRIQYKSASEKEREKVEADKKAFAEFKARENAESERLAVSPKVFVRHIEVWDYSGPSPAYANPFLSTQFYKDNKCLLESNLSDKLVLVRKPGSERTVLHSTRDNKIDYAEYDAGLDRIFSIGEHHIRIWKPTRPENWSGVWRLGEFWLLAVFVLLTGLNFWRDRKIK